MRAALQRAAAAPGGLEGRASADDHMALRLWLRLLSCSTEVENEIRKRLRREFGMTLARFDYMAQLQREPQGMRMTDISRRLMVTGGSVTGLTDELESDGLVAREGERQDRRTWRVRLTAKGRRVFDAAAAVHEQWVVELFGGLTAQERTQLHDTLGRLRGQLAARLHPAPRSASTRD
jgi:DNA-binding MarR family transcriptional regulator